MQRREHQNGLNNDSIMQIGVVGISFHVVVVVVVVIVNEYVHISISSTHTYHVQVILYT